MSVFKNGPKQETDNHNKASFFFVYSKSYSRILMNHTLAITKK